MRRLFISKNQNRTQEKFPSFNVHCGAQYLKVDHCVSFKYFFLGLEQRKERKFLNLVYECISMRCRSRNVPVEMLCHFEKKGRKIRLNLERGAVSREVRKETQFTNSAKAQTFFFFKEKGHLLISTS